MRWYLDPTRSGRAEYERGHLPGAVWLDIDTDLSDPPSPEAGRHPLPTPERFAAALGRVGIAAGTPVVAYDDAGGSIAARLWWLLHVLGEPAAVLDGGIAAWPGELTTDVPAVRPVERAPRPWPRGPVPHGRRAGRAPRHVLDARTAQRYARRRPGDRPAARATFPVRAADPGPETSTTDGRFRSPRRAARAVRRRRGRRRSSRTAARA